MTTFRNTIEEEGTDVAVKKRKPNHQELLTEEEYRKDCNCCDKITINALPNEILVKIFGFLDVVKQHKCRRVCRRWLSLLTSQPVLREMLVDQFFFMTDELRTRYIGYDQCIKRALTPFLIGLNLSGRVDRRYTPSSAKTAREPLLNLAICRMLRDWGLQRPSSTNGSKVIIFDSGCFGLGLLRSLLLDCQGKIRKILFSDVTIHGVRTAAPGLNVYFYDLFIHTGKMRLEEGQTKPEEVDQVIWQLFGQTCAAFSKERKENLQANLDEIASTNQAFLQKITEIIRMRQPNALQEGKWKGDVDILNPLTQTDIEAYMKSAF